MRLSYLLCLTVLATGVIFSSFAEDDEKKEKTRYVKVTTHLANIFVDNVNPKPDQIVRQTKQGEYLVLRTAGESWYRVTVDGRDGYLRAVDGKIVNSKIGSILALIMTIIVLLGCAGGVFFYIKKQKEALS
ncbi:MAG: hypothetical protein FWE57_11725 [Chitinispirillia bacterium]|nr:hypothetical protein [Chitinispirillia bacterium]